MVSAQGKGLEWHLSEKKWCVGLIFMIMLRAKMKAERAARADYFKRVQHKLCLCMKPSSTIFLHVQCSQPYDEPAWVFEFTASLWMSVSKQIKVMMRILRRFKTTDYLTKKDIAKITDTLALINIQILLALASKLVRTTIIYVSFKSINR